MGIRRLKITESIERWEKELRGVIGEEVGGVEFKREDYERWLCRNDLWYLAVKLGMKEIGKYRGFYEKLCHEISLINWVIVKNGVFELREDMLGLGEVDESILRDESAYFWFRSGYKTTIQKVCIFQLLLNFPNIRIVIVHNKQENASDILVSVKQFFFNPYIRQLFGKEYIPKGRDWGNRTGFSVKKRSDKTKNEENVEAIGVDTEVTGRHYDVMFIDDIETDKSVNTEEQIKKTKDWFEYSKSLFDNPTKPIRNISGTFYHYAGLNMEIASNSRYKLSKIGFEDEEVKKHLWGKRFDKSGIEYLKKDMWIYSCQFLMKPEDPSQRRFTDEMVCYYSVLPKNLNYYLLVDPANSKRKKSDWTVEMVVGVDSHGNRYVADIVRDKLDTKERVDESFRLIKKYEVKGVAWETIGFQETDMFYFNERRRIEGVSFGLTQISHHKVSKRDRIMSLIPEYSNHRWLWCGKGILVKYIKALGKSVDMVQEMEYELFQFPMGIHDDIIDSMTFLNLMPVQKAGNTVLDVLPDNCPAKLMENAYKEELELHRSLPRRLRNLYKEPVCIN